MQMEFYFSISVLSNARQFPRNDVDIDVLENASSPNEIAMTFLRQNLTY